METEMETESELDSYANYIRLCLRFWFTLLVSYCPTQKNTLLQMDNTKLLSDTTDDDIEAAKPEDIPDRPSEGDGCIDGCLSSPHLKNWFLTLGLWSLIAVQFVCLAQLNSLCSCDCWYWSDSSLSTICIVNIF